MVGMAVSSQQSAISNQKENLVTESTQLLHTDSRRLKADSQYMEEIWNLNYLIQEMKTY